uniref:SFRICE_010761 n=1 Tax=Spodoptera frugiperda TaxID=7108 RepID=A0A2H1WSR3_SPOFR
MNFLKNKPRARRNSASVMVSTERWRNYSRRMSRRGHEMFEDDVDEYEPARNKEVKNWIEELFERKSDADEVEQDIDIQLTKKQTLILSTLVPDEILLMDKFNSVETKRFVGVLLMADVSGYTALSERYNNTGKGGTYRLTATLNTYLGALIELIYGHGGDIIKFAGDAFLALWKTDKRSFLSHTIHTVIACALIIQHSYAIYETDVKVNLRVKLAISAGNIIFAPIGTGIDMSYIIFGLPVIEAKAAESVCASGEVKLTPTAWGHCYSRNYDHVIHENGFVTIKSILYDPHESNVTKPFAGFGNLIRQSKKPFSAIESLPDVLLDSSKGTNVTDALRKTEALSLRKAILVAEEKNIGSEIRRFMIRPVLTQIDAHQPLEYLTEMRQVSILFVTLKPRECSFAQLITIVNNSYQITCEIVYKSMGCVNKIILFDKDVMILVVFGLRGFKHESEAQAALKCAYSIKKSVAALDGVLEVSIGVTTGQVYCGVVGHPLRREFTVIGAIVNKAARLMCGFRNKITCDEMTFVKSKMSTNSFTLQPAIELKGIVKPGKIYEYSEEIRVKELYDIPMIPPLLNRSDELEYFEAWLEDSKSAFRDFDALLMIGESRIGKSRMLEWMARFARNQGYQVCYLNLTSIHSATAYLALSQIMNQMLELKEPVEGFAKEEKIIQLLKVYSDDLCYLNNIIKVRFAYHERIHSLDENKRKEKAKAMFEKLIKALPQTIVIFLDDLQNLDSLSWEFISMMFKTMKIFIVLSVTRGKFSAVHNWLYSVFINDNIRKMALGPLDPEWIPALACQILDVDGVSNDLCAALRSKCKGMPGLVESFIIHLFSSGALEIRRIEDTEIEEWEEEEELQFPEPALLHPQALDGNNQDTLDKLIENDNKGDISICIVIDKKELNTNINVHNLDTLIMIQIDSLTPYQQLLLKIASVIGDVIPRDLLENIMYENNPLITAKAIKRLFCLRILSCANTDCLNKFGRRGTSTLTILSGYSQASNPNIVCDCCFEYDAENEQNLPKYAFCKLMRFRSKNSRKTCYELLPMNQKKEFHTRIVNYLENNKQKCTSCGGTVMVVQSMLSLTNEASRSGYSSVDTITTQVDDSLQSSEESESSSSSQSSHNLVTTKSETVSISKENLKPIGTTSEILATKTLKDGARHERNNSIVPPILKLKGSTIEVNPPTTNEKRTKKVTMTNFSDPVLSDSEEIPNCKIFDMLREVTEADAPSDWQNLGIIDSQEHLDEIEKKKDGNTFSVKIEKGVSETNFARCTCAELNITICEQIVHHAEHADLKSKAVEFLIKYSHLSVLSNNFENVFEKLDDAENLCQSLQNLDPFEKKRFFGQIHTIRAAACLSVGRLAASKLELEQATQIYNINLHKVPEYLKLKNLAKAFKFRNQKYRLHKAILKADSVYCLNVATLLYSMLGEERVSRTTALRALNIVQTVECSVVNVCETYCNAIQVEMDRGAPEATADIEQMAANSLKALPRPIQADELFAVGKLFMTTFRARMARGQLAPTIRSGFRALAVSRFLQAEDISLELIPDLFYILLTRRRIEEAIDILQFALRTGQDHMSYESENWYHALCMDMILDAGFQLESPQDISRFAEYSISKGKSAGPSRRRLVVGLWTYWLRADSEKKAKRFEAEALSWASHEDDSSMMNLLSAMRLAEGMLESLARKMDDLRKVVDLMELRSVADRELARLENDARLLGAALPRWSLLKANSSMLSGRNVIANSLFNQALEEARKMNNRLEEAMVRATSSNSVIWIQNARTGQFVHWLYQPYSDTARVIEMKDNKNIVFTGIIASSSSLNNLEINSGYIAVQDGKITKRGSTEEFDRLEKSGEFSTFEIVKLSPDQFIIPGFVDCHTHAPQFPNIGLGLDRPLLEWLAKYTFHLEKKYSDTEFAAKVYDQVVQRLLKNGTTTACYFGSLHVEGTLELVKSAIKHHQRALIGKVSMNKENFAGYYNETKKELEEVETFIKHVISYQRRP